MMSLSLIIVITFGLFLFWFAWQFHGKNPAKWERRWAPWTVVGRHVRADFRALKKRQVTPQPRPSLLSDADYVKEEIRWFEEMWDEGHE